MAAHALTTGQTNLTASNRWLAFNDSTGIHLDHTVGNMQIAVIMGNYNQRLSPLLHVRQQLLLEDPPKRRILIGCPLVQYDDRPILKKYMYQSKAFALTRGKIDRGKDSITNRDLVSNFYFFEIMLGLPKRKLIHCNEIIK